MSILDSEIFRTVTYRPYQVGQETYQLSNYPYLDIVMTDKCNSKCRFCIADLLHGKVDGDFPTFQEQIIHAAYNMGVREVLLLGGEPTIAPMLWDVITTCNGLKSIGLLNKICITTNGKKLRDPAFLDRLMRSGITHLNLSIMSFDAEQQNFIHGSRSNLTLEDLRDISEVASANGVQIRVNNNVYLTNNDAPQAMMDFMLQVGPYCDSIKFSPLLKTDSFSVVPEVNDFNRDYILSDEKYEKLFNHMVGILREDGGIWVQNPNTFGFVEYQMVMPGSRSKVGPGVPVIFNYNHRGRMMAQAVQFKQINNIKLLPNGNLSRSWNREELDHVIRFPVK